MPKSTDPTFYRTRRGDRGPARAAGLRRRLRPRRQGQGRHRGARHRPPVELRPVVGWSELPTAGNELHHFGWNACSSALCHQGHGDHGHGALERRYLLVPGLRSSRTYVLDTKPDPATPRWSGDRGRGAGRQGRLLPPPHPAPWARRHLHVNLGGANGNDGPGGVALLDHDTFDVIGAWEHDRASSTSPTTSGGT